LIIRRGRILTMDESFAELEGDIRIADGRVVEIAPHVAHRGSGETEIDAHGMIVLPGLVQAHVHLCQTLLRNAADDLELLDWLRDYVWPYEAWLDAPAMGAAARLGLHELIAGGTTAVLDMGSVRHTDVLFTAAAEAGIRYTGGKCLMDLNEGGVGPGELFESADLALLETEELIARWHGKEGGRLRYAVAPRFAVTSTEDLLRRAVVLACRTNARVHTHASENLGEVDVIRRRTGRSNIDYLVDMGVLGSQTALAHCVHLDAQDMNLIWGSGTHVVHCPSSNLKLASGIAQVPELLDQGINVALGADGAPCNNRLSIFREMHLAALIQKPRRGPTAMPARDVLRMSTLGGARALGLEDEIGSIEVGKRADLVVLDLDRPETVPWSDPYSAIVYAAGAASVRDVIVDGRVLKRDGAVLSVDGGRAVREAKAAAERFAARGR
jgi:5-methylthioadenosine/S-adenosylhomocysteine deaminase